MNHYNGFSPTERAAAANEHRRTKIATGAKPETPPICDTCGQTDGALMWHSEDYGDPEKVGAFGLCYICHMMIHCRFRSPRTFRAYCNALKRGQRFFNYPTRNWPAFRADFLQTPYPFHRGFEVLEPGPDAGALMEAIGRGDYDPRG